MPIAAAKAGHEAAGAAKRKARVEPAPAHQRQPLGQGRGRRASRASTSAMRGFNHRWNRRSRSASGRSRVRSTRPEHRRPERAAARQNVRSAAGPPVAARRGSVQQRVQRLAGARIDDAQRAPGSAAAQRGCAISPVRLIHKPLPGRPEHRLGLQREIDAKEPARAEQHACGSRPAQAA